jgi:hypothetical protein
MKLYLLGGIVDEVVLYVPEVSHIIGVRVEFSQRSFSSVAKDLRHFWNAQYCVRLKNQVGNWEQVYSSGHTKGNRWLARTGLPGLSWTIVLLSKSRTLNENQPAVMEGYRYEATKMPPISMTVMTSSNPSFNHPPQNS